MDAGYFLIAHSDLFYKSGVYLGRFLSVDEMSPANYEQERKIASIAVQCASLLTKAVMWSIKHVSKSDSTPVTVADFAIQALLISTLSHAFPSDSFLGEESAAALRDDDNLRQQVWEMVSTERNFPDLGGGNATVVKPSSPEQMMELIDRGGLGAGGRTGRVWIMDPIDGTATFIEGGQYAVALALIDDGKEVLGVIGCPNLRRDMNQIDPMLVDDADCGFMISAVRGDGGVLLQPISTGDLPQGEFIAQRLEQSDSTQLISPENLNFVDSTMGEEYHLGKAKQFVNGLRCAKFPGTNVWSTQLRLIIIALGLNDTQIRVPPPKAPGGEEDPENYIWDYAGAHLILEEAGAVASDLDGKEVDFGAGRRLASNWGLVAASSKHLHRHVLDKVQDFLMLG